MGTADLEVHIAEEVLQTLDIHHGAPAVTLGDQTAGDTGYRSLDGHTSVHQSQSGAADGSLGGGTVGGEHFRYQTQGIGELLNRRDHRTQGLLSQSAVTDLPAARATGRTGLTHRVGGEVVVMDVALFGLLIDAVQQLGIPDGTQSGNGQHLGLATGEHT